MTDKIDEKEKGGFGYPLLGDVVSREVNHEECVNYNKLHACVRCVYFYRNGESCNNLERLFFKNNVA